MISDMSSMLAELTVDESNVLQVYDDATGNLLKAGMFIKGNPTIGIGTNLVTGITQAESQYLCVNRINQAEQALNANCPWWSSLDEIRARALVNMCFNMGITRLMTFVHFLAAMQAGNWQEAGFQMQQSAWWNQVGQRAVRLQYMIVNGAVQPGAV